MNEIRYIEIDGEQHIPAQADWNVNDPNDPAYVKNRLAWSESDKTVIEWDGNTDGFAYVEALMSYKISDDVPSYDDLLGGKIVTTVVGTMDDNGTVYTDEDVVNEITADNLADAMGEGIPAYLIWAGANDLSLVAVVYDDAPDLGLEKGVYFGKGGDDNGTAYISSLEYSSETIHPIDPEFLPDLPFFDLVEMGLSPIMPGAGIVSLETDTSKIISAIEKGSVKMHMNVAGISVVAILSFMRQEPAGTYGGTVLTIANRTPMVGQIGIASDGIYAQAIVLATAQ